MSEKDIKSRIVHKHDTEANWSLAVNFIPKQGEFIVYDKDSTYAYERFKIGDGSTNVNNLPFAAGDLVASAITNDEIDTICGTTISLAEDVLL